MNSGSWYWDAVGLWQAGEGVRSTSINFFANKKTKIEGDKFGGRGSIKIM